MGSPATPLVDAGAPFEHGSQPAQGAPAPQKTEVEKRLEALENDLKNERSLRREAEESAKYWANQGRRAPAIEEPESDDEPIQETPIEEDPQALLDDIAKEGYSALKKRGFVREADVQRLVREAEQRAAATIEQRDSERAFDSQLGTEFPELVADSKRIAAGQPPQTELWKRAAEIYRESVALDPSLKSSRSALIIAARQAKAELGKAKPASTTRDEGEEEPEPTQHRGAARRARIQSQAPEPRRSSRTDDDDDSPVIGDQAKEVLKRLNVSEQDYLKNMGGARGR